MTTHPGNLHNIEPSNSYHHLFSVPSCSLFTKVFHRSHSCIFTNRALLRGHTLPIPQLCLGHNPYNPQSHNPSLPLGRPSIPQHVSHAARRRRRRSVVPVPHDRAASRTGIIIAAGCAPAAAPVAAPVAASVAAGRRARPDHRRRRGRSRRRRPATGSVRDGRSVARDGVGMWRRLQGRRRGARRGSGAGVKG